MEIYLGRSPSATKFNNPFRVDSDPSCTLMWYKNRLLLKDWALGISWGIVDVAALKYGYLQPQDNPYEALKGKYSTVVEKMHQELIWGKNLPKIDTQFSNYDSKEKKETDIKVVLREWTSFDFDYWKMTAKQLSQYHIYPIQYALVDGYSTMVSSPFNPTYGYYFPEYSTVDRQIWKIYKPKSKEFGGNKKWISNTKADHLFKTW